MKIYLAGSCSKKQRTIMTTIAAWLRERNEDVYCPFELKIDEKDENGNWTLTQEEWAQKVFEHDKEAIDNAELFLMVTPGRVSTAGTNWEQGYAYAKGKIVKVLQYTKAKTSLMTFCGKNNFKNTTRKNLLIDLEKLIYKNDNDEVCKTVLT